MTMSLFLYCGVPDVYWSRSRYLPGTERFRYYNGPPTGTIASIHCGAKHLRRTGKPEKGAANFGLGFDITWNLWTARPMQVDRLLWRKSKSNRRNAKSIGKNKHNKEKHLTSYYFIYSCIYFAVLINIYFVILLQIYSFYGTTVTP